MLACNMFAPRFKIFSAYRLLVVRMTMTVIMGMRLGLLVCMLQTFEKVDFKNAWC